MEVHELLKAINTMLQDQPFMDTLGNAFRWRCSLMGVKSVVFIRCIHLEVSTYVRKKLK